jgi:RNA polymerase sigma-70 factor, ECF subfamily
MDDLGDPREFERAYREHSRRVFAAALGVLRDPGDAEDVVQDVFEQLWRRPRAFDPARGPLRRYVALVARSRAVDRRRGEAARGAAHERLAAATGVAHAPGADERAIERERARGLNALLDGLPEPQREALLLAFGLGLSGSEVAVAAGLPLGTAKSRIRLGMARLRDTATP